MPSPDGANRRSSCSPRSASALGMTHVLLPYMVLALYGVMRKIDPVLPTRRRKSRRTPVRRVPARFPAAEPAGRRQWLRSRVHHVPRLLHHADPARDAQGHDDLAADQPADRGPAGLGLSPPRSPSFCSRRRSSCSASTIALPVWIGCGDDRHDDCHGAPRPAPARVDCRALPGRAVGDHRADVVLEGGLVRVSAAGLLDRLLRPVLREPFLARGHRQLASSSPSGRWCSR